MHIYSAQKNIQLLRKVYGMLNLHGFLVIKDQVAIEASGSLAKLRACLEGLELFNSVKWQTFPLDEMESWLVEASFSNPTSK